MNANTDGLYRSSNRRMTRLSFLIPNRFSVSPAQCIGWSLKENVKVKLIEWNDFVKVELRIGKIIQAEAFAKAKKPAYVLHVDFGDEIGIKKSSAQITELYRKDELIGKLIVAVVNFPKKQIGPLMSECLVTGFHNENGEVALCVPDKSVPLGTKLL